MSKSLLLGKTGGKDFSIPIDAVCQTFAILAKRGSGKSYCAAVMAEELLKAGQQIIYVDPTGCAWGLRSVFPVVIIGGEHADVPLEEGAGEVIAQAIVENRFSAVIDLSLLRKGQLIRFMTAFAETLYRLNREPVHLFVDEADAVAPQDRKYGGDENRMLGAMEDIVRRGRKRGIGCTLITQRPAVLNKNVLTQVEVLVALRMVHPKDIDAIEEWVNVHGDPKQAKKMIDELPALPIGHAWFWSPGWGDFFTCVEVRERETFDSGATPKAGKAPSQPKKLAEIDIKALGEQIRTTVEKAKAQDPKTLQRRIAELEKQVSKPKESAAPASVPVINHKALERLSSAVEAAMKILVEINAKDFFEQAGPLVDQDKLHAAIDGAVKLAMKDVDGALSRRKAEFDKYRKDVERALTQMRSILADKDLKVSVSVKHNKPFTAAVAPALSQLSSGRAPRRNQEAEGTTRLPIGERAVLSACIQFENGLERGQLTVLTGYKRSSRDAYVARLKEKGYVETRGVLIVATESGIAALPDFTPLPTGLALQEYWNHRLPIGEKSILDLLIHAHPEFVSRDVLSNSTGYMRSSRDAYISRLAAKELVEIGSGAVKAAESLF